VSITDILQEVVFVSITDILQELVFVSITDNLQEVVSHWTRRILITAENYDERTNNTYIYFLFTIN
jgi:predicted RecB family endonuclease